MENVLRIGSVLDKLLDGVVSPTADPMVIANQRGEIVYINFATERFFGWARAEIIGRPITLLIPERYLPAHEEAFKRVRCDLSSAKYLGKVLVAHAVKKDGSEAAVEIALDSIALTKGIFFIATIKETREPA